MVLFFNYYAVIYIFYIMNYILIFLYLFIITILQFNFNTF
ncbi:hypothetical protein Alsa3_CDS0177 [Staphylococcus phage Alsa_3]|nr:hypothetical protein Alsa3_CDS0177 [Staphylococcus phage Alsa_3]WNM51302.1 hypothetical protein Alsa4_CDS0172 [Staphylococcus phage Alsa_4]